MHIRRNIKDGIKIDINILLLGDTGSGKSTLLSVLANNELDNGKGLMRGKILNYAHEFMTGST